MRQYLRVAVIEVSEESLRLIVGDEALGQAARLVDSGLVADVRLDGLLVFATVDGTPVSVRVLDDALAWKCPCPDDAPCVHAVAAALAWVRTGTDEETPDLLTVLQEQSTAWLALRLAAIADGNALNAHEEEAAREAEDGYGEWYPDFEEVEALSRRSGPTWRTPPMNCAS